MWVIAVGLVAISLVTARTGGPDDPASAVEQGTAALMLATVGAILVSRLPRHPIGWLLAIGGLVIALSGAASGLADFGLNAHPGTVAAAIWLAWLSQWLWAPELACLFILLPLFYPTGRLPSPRWRAAVVIAALVVILGGVGGAVGPWVPDPYPVANPLAGGAIAADLAAGLGIAVTLLVVIGGALAVSSLVVRYLRAATIERQQLKWFATVATVTAVAGTVNITAYAASGSSSPTGTLGLAAGISGFFIFAGLALLPLAIGIAVLRYRLYDIDVVIRRTLVYVPLTALLAGLYAALITSLQRLFIAATGNPSDGAVILSTLVLAATFTPIKNAIQGIVDRRFRDAEDGERRLQLFVDALAGGLAKPDPIRTMRGFLGVAVALSGAPGGRALAWTGRAERRVGEAGAAFAEAAVAVPVAAAGSRLGRVELAGRRDGRPYSDADLSLLFAAGEQVASAALGLETSPPALVAGNSGTRGSLTQDPVD